jgi:hypothetical protein
VRDDRVYREHLHATTANTISYDDEFPNDDYFPNIDNLNMGDNIDDDVATVAAP